MPPSWRLTALERPVDKYLDYALWLTLRELQPYWMPALQEGRLDYGGQTNRLLFALQAAGTKSVLPTLVDLVKKNKVPAEGEEGVLTMIAALGSPAELGLVFDRAASELRSSPAARPAAGGPGTDRPAARRSPGRRSEAS